MKGLALHGVNDLFDLVGVRREDFEGFRGSCERNLMLFG